MKSLILAATLAAGVGPSQEQVDYCAGQMLHLGFDHVVLVREGGEYKALINGYYQPLDVPYAILRDFMPPRGDISVEGWIKIETGK